MWTGLTGSVWYRSENPHNAVLQADSGLLGLILLLVSKITKAS